MSSRFTSSDIGKLTLPLIADGMALFAQLLLDADFSAEEVHQLTVTNPKRVLAGD